jgi:glycosyltransferase involved in cell wall biosynthesis
MILNLVIPWFGNANGGAEVYAAGFARALGRAGHEVRVLATCCPDPFHDWGTDGLPPGITEFASGVTLHRFPVRPRNGGKFAMLYSELEAQGGLSDTDAEDFFAESISSAAMEEWLWDHATDRGLTLFMPYLYGTSIYGTARLPRERIVLVPCLHNEAAAYTAPVARMFQRAAACLFLSDGERDLARALYGIGTKPHAVIGGGIDLHPQADPARFREKYQLGTEPYLLAVGRKVPLKGQQLLIELYRRWRARGPRLPVGQPIPKLVLVGSGEVDIPSDSRQAILHITGATDQDVQDATAGCKIFIHPSFVESFSLVMMQAWAHHRPVLVNGECEVTLQHARRSGGGLSWSSQDQFCEALETLLSNDELCSEMGRAGRAYVEERCDWDRVAARTTELLERILPASPPVWCSSAF